MSALNQDIVYEVRDARPLIETWVLRFATVVSSLLLVAACGSLYASLKAVFRTFPVYAVTESGEVFQLPFFTTEAEARSLAAELDESGRGQDGPTKTTVHP